MPPTLGLMCPYPLEFSDTPLKLPKVVGIQEAI